MRNRARRFTAPAGIGPQLAYAVGGGVERELVELGARLFDPAPDAVDGEHAADDAELEERRQADDQQRDAERGERGQDGGTGEVDLLAGRRDVGLERAHET